MERIIFHIDVNSAYLSWEAVDRLKKGDTLDLRTIPSIVGGDESKRKGIVLAKSYPCSPYNIKTADTIFSATQKCRDLVIVPPQYDLYTKCSDEMYNLLTRYSDRVEQYSIDEMFLDVSFAVDDKESAIKLADTIRHHVHDELGFTVCVGIGINKLTAKMATDFRKPNFTNTLFPDEMEKLWSLPVSKLMMVGRQTNKRLHNLGIHTIGELADFDVHILEAHLKSHGRLIWEYANGVENSPVRQEAAQEKGIGNSTTTPRDVENTEDAREVLLSLCEKVGHRLRDRQFFAKVVAVSITRTDFKNYSRQRKLETPIDSTDDLYEIIKELFDEAWDGKPIRQLGVRVADLREEKIEQLSLFDMKPKSKLDKTIDSIREKHGNDAVYRARFTDSDVKPMEGGTGDGEYTHMRSQL